MKDNTIDTALDYETYWDNNESHSLHPSVRMRNQFIIDTLIKLNKKTNFWSLLDAWCGDGHLIQLISGHFQGKRLSWLDYSQAVVDRNNNNFPKVQFIHGDLGQSNNIKEQFDVVVCSEVIEHIEDRKQVIENLCNLCNNKWYIILSTQSGTRYPSDLINGHLKHFDLKELEDEFIAQGCDIVFSYKKWRPFYDLQKKVHSMFMEQARSVQYGKPSWRKKCIFSIVYRLFLCTPTSRTLWTQIYMCLQKK